MSHFISSALIMQTGFCRQRQPLVNALAIVIVLCTFQALSAAEESPSAAGTWNWKFTMPNGTAAELRARLTQDGERLTGTTSFRPGTETEITEGHVRGNSVHFKVTRTRDGETAVTTYTGTLQGDTIQGSIESNWTGEPRKYEWLARRAPQTVAGTWAWSTSFGERTFENKLRLKQEGDKLTGKISGGRRDTDISAGTIDNGRIAFEVRRERDGTEFVTKYRGRLDGDQIIGEYEMDFGGTPRAREWKAHRVNE